MEKRAITHNPSSRFLSQLEEQENSDLCPFLQVVGALIPEATIKTKMLKVKEEKVKEKTEKVDEINMHNLEVPAFKIKRGKSTGKLLANYSTASSISGSTRAGSSARNTSS